ncbi:MAG: Diacylglycerol kinase [Caldanaerobacter subterraneus]|uniref:Diacylglycerol kinase n=2 Tax=Caldanaerobacter subterraneus TaxID=911092 RepID=Q8RB51_CALS4|nr:MULTISPECIES: diacylglycerol kinase [Caldanaerobacter]AAM24228.1 Diacylglycerol kinase [Caldanaerobacter subterraneus subsp. tengcongensis MB4]KUK09241.1 MAG: Diacylglycerol kinase [Caldanaerobacter subterraneus]MCS3916244.1 diacylglycerol kinase (ATP) [Caldanaerobacter subterraneus subsp. tengcongensis MB4]MDI3519009.1 diacylglycerol kinase [Caldanaerobacter sp.]MDK2794542.1 diacylglycerol kinase [Caldanaerobacter sp.]
MKSRNLIDSFNYAIEGILHVFKTQRNMKIHFAIAIAVLFFCLFLDLTRVEFVIILFTISLVLIAEMINTAIETTIDMLVRNYNPMAKIAKNVAAGAVLIAAVNSVLVAYLIFFDRVNPWTKIVLVKIRESPIHVTVISILVVVFLTLILKVYFKKGTPMRGGMPSAHSAIAFSVATAITFMTANAFISTLSFLLALMVAESRVEGKIHTFSQVFVGAILGILFTVLIFQIIR